MEVPQPIERPWSQVDELLKEADQVVYVMHKKGMAINIAAGGANLENLPKLPGQLIGDVRITFPDGCSYTLTRNPNQKKEKN